MRNNSRPNAYTRELVKITSAKNKNIVMFAAANGILMIAEKRQIMVENGPFDADNMIICDVDTELILHERITSDDFDDEGIDISEAEPIDLYTCGKVLSLKEKFHRHRSVLMIRNCWHQTAAKYLKYSQAALAKRLAAIHAKKSVVGISGGLDSTFGPISMHICPQKARECLQKT